MTGREPMAPWEVEREDVSPDDLDAAGAFYDAEIAAARARLLARIHKAAPGAGVNFAWCAVCGQPVLRVQGSRGPTWVHEDSGAVVARNPPEREEGSADE